MADPAPHGDLLGDLRRATAPDHAALEAASGLPGTIRSEPDYVRVLRALLGAHEALEQALAGAPEWAALGLEPSERRKAHLIRADLTALGAEERPSSTPPVRLGTGPARVGAIYVVEGSTLGGVRMAPLIEDRLGLGPTRASRFLRAYGSRSGAMWRQVTDGLRRWGAASTAEDRREAAAGARAAFGTFRDALSDA